MSCDDSEKAPASSRPDVVVTGPSAEQHCQTIAHVAALSLWAERKLPEIAHLALLDGVASVEVAAAASMTVDDLAHRWQRWARHVETLSGWESEQVEALLFGTGRVC